MARLNRTGIDSSARGDHHRDSSDSVVLLLTMADTTWRIFVPIILLVGVGIWADVNFNTKPLITFLGLAIGALIAVALVRMQIKKIKE